MQTVTESGARITKINATALFIEGAFTPMNRWVDIDFDSLEWECAKPDWFDHTLGELTWAKESGERFDAIMIRGKATLKHPYALTLRDWLEDLGADWEYDPYMECFKVADPHDHADSLRDICEFYGIATSPTFEDTIDGLDQAVATVAGNSKDALNEGFVVPSGFASGRVLKPHQEEAVLSLAYNGGGLLADQVGLGKGGEFTCGLLCLNDYLESQDADPNYPVIVAVTKSMKLEIAEEITRWKHDAVIEVISSTKAAPISEDAEFIIINHDILSRRLDDLIEARPKAFIADEAHVYKNKDTSRAKAAIEIAKSVRANSDDPYVVMATGTPFLNAPRELWALMIILGWEKRFFNFAKERYREENGKTTMRMNLGRKKNRFAQKSKFAKSGGTGSGTINWGERELYGQRAFEIRWCGGAYDKYGAWWNNKATHTAELNRLLLEAGMIRRRKSDVIKPLPPLEEALFRFDLDDATRSRYDEISDEFRKWLIEEVRAEAERDGRNSMRAVEEATRKLLAGEDVMRLTKLRAELSLMKVPHTVEWVHRFMSGEMDADNWDGSRRKLILYVHHREARQALVDEPSFAQYNPVTILSGTEQKDQSIVDHKRRFQADDDVRLIICSMAAREGHTLTAAKDVYLHEMPFVPSWIVQMAGRCWARFSEQFEPHEAYLHYAIADETIDSMLVRMNAVKKSMFSSVIDGEGQSEGEDDLLFGKAEKESGETWQEARERQTSKLLEAFSIGARELGIAK